jgi:hypothetical protein
MGPVSFGSGGECTVHEAEPQETNTPCTAKPILFNMAESPALTLDPFV